MIYHRIAIEIAHLRYLYHFIEILYRIGAFLEIPSSVFRILISGVLFFWKLFFNRLSERNERYGVEKVLTRRNFFMKK